MMEEDTCPLCATPQTLGRIDDPHRACSLRSALGGIGHLLAHDYWCTQRHDPDAGLTYRQSALLVDQLVAMIGVEAAVMELRDD